MMFLYCTDLAWPELSSVIETCAFVCGSGARWNEGHIRVVRQRAGHKWILPSAHAPGQGGRGHAAESPDSQHWHGGENYITHNAHWISSFEWICSKLIQWFVQVWVIWVSADCSYGCDERSLQLVLKAGC